MDITAYKETLKRGETVSFLLSKKKILPLFILCVVLALGGVCLAFLSKGEVEGLVVGVASLLVFGISALLVGKGLAARQIPVLTMNKEVLTIYELSIPALSGKQIPGALIPWHEILNMDIQTIKMQKGGSTSYIVLQCVPLTIQNIKQYKKQISYKLFRVYEIEGEEFLVLNLSAWLDIPLEDLLALLQEAHAQAIAPQQ